MIDSPTEYEMSAAGLRPTERFATLFGSLSNTPL
jgi:hypothetical protein